MHLPNKKDPLQLVQYKESLKGVQHHNFPLIFFILLCYCATRWCLLRGLPYQVPSFENIWGLVDKILSTCHACFITLSAVLYLTKWIGLKNWQRLLCLTIGHLMGDSIFEIFGAPQTDYLICIHHFVLLLIIFLYKDLAPRLLAQGLVGEIVLPPLYYCWYLIQINQKDSFIFLCCSIIVLLMWLLLRICNFTYILFKIYKLRKRICFLAFSPLVLMSYYWFYCLSLKAYTLVLGHGLA